jgi:uncharacterized protein (TIGR02246 family)
VPRPLDDAHEILRTLQARVDLRDPEALIDLFDDPAVLIGAAGDGRNRETLREYLTVVATQPEPLRWDWEEVAVFHESPGAIGFAAFGDLVYSADGKEQRAPIRATLVAVEAPDGWRLRHFHGSIPLPDG